MQRVLTTVTLLGLLVATAGAFAITEHLKLQKGPLYGVEVSAGQLHRAQAVIFSPVCAACETKVARVDFKLRHRDPVTLTIVDSDDHTVATRGGDQLLGAHSPQHLVWDGRSDTGQVVPDGVYYAWLYLAHERHTFKFANKITVDTQPPRVRSAKGLKRVLLAGPGRSLAIHYAFSEKAHAVVYLGGRKIILGHQTEGSKIKWNGKLNHRAVPAGRYVLSIGAQDLAGNETPAAGRKHVPVDVFYVELTPERITVRGGRPFRVHVTTAARRYTWRLGQRHGERRGRTLRLRAPSTPGTYRLVVAENGQATTAVVKVRAK